MKTLVLLGSALLLSANLAAVAQYNYSYGSSRVVRQRSNGLEVPSSTYIGAGTLSQTARGEDPGGHANGLPQVNMGANIRTPGDNVYRPGAIQYQRRQPLRLYQGNNNQQPGSHYYTPGQNSQDNQGQYRSGLGSYSSGGTSSYGSAGTVNSNGVRRF